MNVRELFENALALPPAERERFLARECRDAARRKVVESLLAADAACEARVLDGPFDALLDRVGDAGAEARPPPAGTRVGPFVLRERLGEGGSSIVYRAEREQAGVVQVVALKLLRRGIYSAEETARFRRERLALAQLRHPGIARLVEGGVTEAAVPYIALELVEGMPITDYAREHRLDLRARLRLFVATCRAVEAAHRALIVHRDLKPSNVLVARDGEVKLLDFGIAKLLDDDAADGTQTQHRALTPAYAAPEQFEGGAITTATDVYALGVLLGELVAGDRRSAHDRHTPSSRIGADTSPGVLPAPPRIARRQLRGDLDNIVMKASAAEPERRYASAGALADDVERHLAGQPVAAHPPSRAYRLRKFVARHKSGVVATLAVALAILAALGVALRQGNIARHAAHRADAMRDFMVSAFAEAEPSTPRKGLPDIAEVVEQAIAKARSDTTLDAQVRTELVSNLGGVLRAQGQLAHAREVLQWNYDHARQDVGEAAHVTLEAAHQLAAVMTVNGEAAPARELVDAALARADDDDPRVLAALRVDSAWIAVRQHDLPRARADAETGLRLVRENGGGDDALAEALSNYGNVLQEMGDFAGAIRASEEQLAIRERQYGKQHAKVADVHINLSRSLARLGRVDEAERHVRAALAIDDAVLPPDHWQRALHLNALTMIAIEKRDLRAALTAAEESLRIDRIAYGGDEHPYTINDLNSVGLLHARLEEWSAALAPLRASLDAAIAKFGAEYPDTALQRANYGTVLARTGDVAGGEREIEHALASLRAAQDVPPDTQAETWEILVRERLDRGDANAALPGIDAIDALLAPVAAPNAYWDGRTATLRANALLQLGRVVEAAQAADAASAALHASRHANAELSVEAPLLRARAARALGRDDADALAHEALAALDALRNPPQRLRDLAAPLRGGG